MDQNRPININPFTIQLPIGALVSITHRLTGIFIFLLIPLCLWSLQLSLASPEGWNQLRDFLHTPWVRIVCWLFCSALGFHILAGCRHLFMDIHLGGSLHASRNTAKGVVLLALVLAVAVAFWVF